VAELSLAALPPARTARTVAGGSFSIFSASDPDERRRWTDIWAGWPNREVFAHPSYLQLYGTRHDRGVAAVYRCDAAVVLYPFLLRSLAEEPYVPEPLSDCYDLITPYGYGGPVFFGDDRVRDEVATAFWAAFDDWASRQRCVSEFVRLSLFPEDRAPYPGQVAFVSKNIVRSLDLSEDELWRDFEHKVRKNVRTARNAGLRVEIDEAGERTHEFRRVYAATMTRRQAYRFADGFFDRLEREMRGQFTYVHVLRDDTVVSTELVLLSHRRAYSFLGGTVAEAFPSRPNDLLKYSTMLWLKSRPHEAFVLGGGPAGEDGIYRYKRAFAPTGERPFAVGRRVFDGILYSALIDARSRYEAASGRVWRPRDDFFPTYRA
jgi:hypothetical protein